jgi:hypothetical protein
VTRMETDDGQTYITFGLATGLGTRTGSNLLATNIDQSVVTLTLFQLLILEISVFVQVRHQRRVVSQELLPVSPSTSALE